MFEKLWSEYFAEECSIADGREERLLLKKSAELSRALSEQLSQSEREALEKYTEAIYDMQAAFMKKAFLKGAEFTFSFLAQVGNYRKR